MKTPCNCATDRAGGPVMIFPPIFRRLRVPDPFIGDSDAADEGRLAVDDEEVCDELRLLKRRRCPTKKRVDFLHLGHPSVGAADSHFMGPS